MFSRSGAAIAFPKRTLRTRGLAAGRCRHARFLKGRFGYSTPARNGTCSRSAIRTTKRFIAAFRPGAAVKFCAAFSWTSPTNCANAACSTKKNARAASFNYLVGAGEQRGRHFETERFRGYRDRGKPGATYDPRDVAVISPIMGPATGRPTAEALRTSDGPLLQSLPSFT